MAKANFRLFVRPDEGVPYPDLEFLTVGSYDWLSWDTVARYGISEPGWHMGGGAAKDLASLSALFPSVTFSLFSNGDDEHWVLYARDGNVEACEGFVVYESPDRKTPALGTNEGCSLGAIHSQYVHVSVKELEDMSALVSSLLKEEAVREVGWGALANELVTLLDNIRRLAYGDTRTVMLRLDKAEE